MKNMYNSPGFIMIIIFTAIYSIICFVINCIPWLGNDVINLPPAYTQYMSNGVNMLMIKIFSLIFPFLACAAFSDSYLSDFNSNNLPIILLRCDKTKYYISKLLTVFCGGFITIVFPQLLNLLLCLIAFPLESTNIYAWDLWQADTYTYIIKESFFLFRNLYIVSPYLYLLVYLMISGVAAGLVAVIAFQLSFFVHNKIFVLSVMFVSMNLTGVLYSSRGIYFDISSYMFGYNAGSQNYRDFAIVFIVYALAAFVPSFFVTKRLKNCI